MSKIYKYTSLISAIKIIRSGKILLSNPSKFNDPFDCSFSIDKLDEHKSFDLLMNYSMIKSLKLFLNEYDLSQNKKERLIFRFIKSELTILNKLLNVYPYYTKMPIINSIIRYLAKIHPELSIVTNEFNTEFKNKIENNFNEFNRNVLVSCFSERNDSILMWSHYADSHRGVCLEYEMPNDKDFAKVIYSNKRPTLNITNMISTYLAHDFIGKELDISKFKFGKELVKPYLVKSKEWAYEREIRCLFHTNDLNNNKISYDGDNYFVDIGRIKRIYIGAKAKGPEIDEIIKLAKNRRIEVVFMKQSDVEFKVIPNINYKHSKSSIKKEETISLLKIIKEIESCLDKNLYLPAFILSLNIPSICGAKLYVNYDVDKQYTKWLDDYFCDFVSHSTNEKLNFPYESSELLFDLKNEFNNHGTFNVHKQYNDFKLDQFVLRIESKKPYNNYVSKSSIITDNMQQDFSKLTINVRSFCENMINTGKDFYFNNMELFSSSDNIIIEDYDKIIDEYNEFLISKSDNYL